MNNNDTVEQKKEEPTICSKFYLLGIMIPEQKTEEIKEETSTNGSRWFAATILIIIAWWILDGWRLMQ